MKLFYMVHDCWPEDPKYWANVNCHNIRKKQRIDYPCHQKGRSCWITPDGQVYPVDPETHDNNYPKSMGSMRRALYQSVMPLGIQCGGINISLHVDMASTICNISDLFQYLQ